MEQVTLDRLTGIIAFARAASLGSYTAASRVLSISPSAVSKSIRRLEERLNVKLFNRTTRSLTLTPEGRDLYQRALRLLREAEEIEQAAFAARTEPSGMIKITSPYPVGVHLIAPHLPEFRRRYPSLSVELHLSDTFTDLIEESIDIAVRIGPLVDSRLIARKLAQNFVYLYASPVYLKENGVPGALDELVHHSLINVRINSSGQLIKWIFRAGDESAEFIPEAQLTANSTDAALAMIKAGGGIGILPSYIVHPYVLSGELTPVLEEYYIVRNDITAFWSESRRGNPNVRVFVEFLDEIFSGAAP
ncbi:LysR family transcriptional regulator [Enterobacter sp. C2]|uniref:LysR family transcriptional regulator n=1 Tax=Enterobacter sp. C2 TaxID=2870346 RepID=UPI001CA3E2CF|nr:LysR family transcriptional regulator [Enterobacter sp. C2]